MKSGQRISSLLFWSLLLITLFPVWMHQWFLTYDGPAHLYNSHLLIEYVTGGDKFIDQYLNFNETVNPNWLGHFILMVFQLLSGPAIAEKLLVTLYVLLTALSFRALIRKINPSSLPLAVLIIPFLINYPFMLGFYNFSLGIGLYFFTLWIWQCKGGDSFMKRTGILLLCLSLTYLAHLFVFVWLLISLGAMIIFERREGWRIFLLQAASLATAAVPGLVGGIFYFINAGGSFTGGKHDFSQLAEEFYMLRPLVTLHFAKEGPYAVAISILFALLFITGIMSLVKRADAGNSKFMFLSLFLSAAALFLYFMLPDSIAGGGYVSVRTCLFIFFSFMLFFISINFSVLVKVFVQLVVLVVVIGRMMYINEETGKHSRDAAEISELTYVTEDYTTILPLNFSDNWFEAHILNYVGIRHNTILWENYEAEERYFPFSWRCNTKRYLWDLIHARPCGDYKNFEDSCSYRIDRIVTWQYHAESADSCAKEVMKLIRRDFDTLYACKRGNAVIYKRKSYVQ